MDDRPLERLLRQRRARQLEAEVKAYAALPSVKGKVKKLIINNAGTSVAAQIAAVDQMIAQHVDAIILDSNSEAGLNATISAAHKAGIVVVAANDRVSSKDAVQIETVGEKFGAAGMEGFVKLLHGKGNIVILRGLAGNAVDAAEAAGFHSVLKKNPGIKVLNESYGKWDDGEAQKVMADLLSRYNNIDGVFTEGGMQQGVVRAYLAAKKKFVPVAGTGRERLRLPAQEVLEAGSAGRAGRLGALRRRARHQDGARHPRRQEDRRRHDRPGELGGLEHGAVDLALQPELLAEPVPRRLEREGRRQPDAAAGPEVHEVGRARAGAARVRARRPGVAHPWNRGFSA